MRLRIADWLVWPLEALHAKSAIRNPQSGNRDGLPPQAARSRNGAPLQVLWRPRGADLQRMGQARRLRSVAAGADDDTRRDHRLGEGVGAARARRGGVPDGTQVVLHAQGKEETALPVRQRRRVRAGDVQGPRDHALDAARAARGNGDRGARDSRGGRLHLYPRRVHRAVDDHGTGARGGERRGRVRQDQDLPASRRGRVHLRRRNRADEFDRGQARQSTNQAAVPGGRGLVRHADDDQQRRDARRGAAHHQARRRVVQEPVSVQSEEHRHEALLGVRQRATPRQL